MRAPLFAALASALLAAPASASHEDYGMGARSAGMGDAVTAVADDPGGVAYNPALASSIAGSQVQAGLRRSFQFPGGASDFDQMEFAAGAPLHAFPWRGAVVVHARSTSLNAVGFPAASGPAGTVNPTSDPTFDVTRPGLKNPSLDRTLGLTYATHGWRETDNGVVDWGVTLKSLSRSGRALAGSVSKAGVDLGIIYHIRERYALGASLINVNGPRTDIGGVPDRAPVTVRLGVAQVTRGFTMSLDAVKREGSQGRRSTQSLAAGMERWLLTGRMGAIAARTGVSMGQQAKTWAWGLGWRALGAQLDYAALVPVADESRWGHAVNLVFRFGSWNPDKEFERLLGSEIHYRNQLANALDGAEVKQWKLAEELRRLRRALEDIQAELTTRTAGEAEAQQKNRAAREKIRGLEEHERDLQQSFDKLEKERTNVVEQSKESLFREDWRAYQNLKLQGAPDLVLLERVKQVLRQYKESGVDLSEANQELRRLLRTQQAP